MWNKCVEHVVWKMQIVDNIVAPIFIIIVATIYMILVMPCNMYICIHIHIISPLRRHHRRSPRSHRRLPSSCRHPLRRHHHRSSHSHYQVLRPLGPYWGHLGPSWGHLGPSWGHLGPSWGHLGPSWGHRCSLSFCKCSNTPTGVGRRQRRILTRERQAGRRMGDKVTRTQGSADGRQGDKVTRTQGSADGPKMASGGLKMAPRAPLESPEAPRSPKMALRSLMMGRSSRGRRNGR